MIRLTQAVNLEALPCVRIRELLVALGLKEAEVYVSQNVDAGHYNAEAKFRLGGKHVTITEYSRPDLPPLRASISLVPDVEEVVGSCPTVLAGFARFGPRISRTCRPKPASTGDCIVFWDIEEYGLIPAGLPPHRVLTRATWPEFRAAITSAPDHIEGWPPRDRWAHVLPIEAA